MVFFILVRQRWNFSIVAFHRYTDEKPWQEAILLFMSPPVMKSYNAASDNWQVELASCWDVMKHWLKTVFNFTNKVQQVLKTVVSNHEYDIFLKRQFTLWGNHKCVKKDPPDKNSYTLFKLTDWNIFGFSQHTIKTSRIKITYFRLCFQKSQITLATVWNFFLPKYRQT